MREEYNSIVSTPTEVDKISRFVLADTDISVKPKYWPGRYISLSLLLTHTRSAAPFVPVPDPHCFCPKPAAITMCLKTTKSSCEVFHHS